MALVQKSVLLLMEINHAHRVRNADDPPFDIVHTLLLRQFRQVERFTSRDDKLHRLVRNGAHLVAEAEAESPVRIRLHLKLPLAVPLRVEDDVIPRIENLDVNVHVRSLRDCIRTLNLGTLMHFLEEAFLFPRRNVEVYRVRDMDEREGQCQHERGAQTGRDGRISARRRPVVPHEKFGREGSSSSPRPN